MTPQPAKHRILRAFGASLVGLLCASAQAQIFYQHSFSNPGATTIGLDDGWYSFQGDAGVSVLEVGIDPADHAVFRLDTSSASSNGYWYGALGRNVDGSLPSSDLSSLRFDAVISADGPVLPGNKQRVGLRIESINESFAVTGALQLFFDIDQPGSFQSVSATLDQGTIVNSFSTSAPRYAILVNFVGPDNPPFFPTQDTWGFGSGQQILVQSLSLQAIPEPSSAASLAGLSTLLLVASRRRRRG